MEGVFEIHRDARLGAVEIDDHGERVLGAAGE